MNAIDKELKEYIFNVIEDRASLKDFEAWLYAHERLAEQMHDDLSLALYSFNYNQRGGRLVFKDTMIRFFDQDEFILWKVKMNLSDIINGRPSTASILDTFCYEFDDYPFLQPIGYYTFRLEDATDAGLNEEISNELKEDAMALLSAIELQEKTVPGFKLSMFRQ